MSLISAGPRDFLTDFRKLFNCFFLFFILFAVKILVRAAAPDRRQNAVSGLSEAFEKILFAVKILVRGNRNPGKCTRKGCFRRNIYSTKIDTFLKMA